MSGLMLIHVTAEENVPSILAEGIRGPSCWSCDEKVVALYTTVVHAYRGKPPAWFATSLDLFPESVLLPDMPSIYEPVTPALDMTEAEVEDAWARSVRGDWRDTLRIVKSLVIRTTVPPSLLRQVDSPAAMVEQLLRQRGLAA